MANNSDITTKKYNTTKLSLVISIILGIFIGATATYFIKKQVEKKHYQISFENFIQTQVQGERTNIYNPMLNYYIANKLISTAPIFIKVNNFSSINTQYLYQPKMKYTACFIHVGDIEEKKVSNTNSVNQFITEMNTNNMLKELALAHEIAHCEFYNILLFLNYNDIFDIQLNKEDKELLFNFIRSNLFNSKINFIMNFNENFADYYGSIMFLKKYNFSKNSINTVKRLLYYRQKIEQEAIENSRILKIPHLTKNSLIQLLENIEYLKLETDINNFKMMALNLSLKEAIQNLISFPILKETFKKQFFNDNNMAVENDYKLESFGIFNLNSSN